MKRKEDKEETCLCLLCVFAHLRESLFFTHRDSVMRWIYGFSFLIVATFAAGREPIRLANNPALSPNGAELAFDWNGDIWSVPTVGGVAKQLTAHPAAIVSRNSHPTASESLS